MSVSTQTRKECLDRQGGRCDYCSHFLIGGGHEAHHRYTRARYKKVDRDDAWNISILHSECHRKIHDVDARGLKRLQGLADIEKPPHLRSQESIRPKEKTQEQIENKRLKRIERNNKKVAYHESKKLSDFHSYDNSDYLEKQKAYAKKIRKENEKKFRDENDGMSPTQLAYKRKKQRLKEKSLDNEL